MVLNFYRMALVVASVGLVSIFRVILDDNLSLVCNLKTKASKHNT